MKRIFLFIALIGLGLASCQKNNEPAANIPEIMVGEANEATVVLDKGTSVDKKLSGGNGKYTLTVQDSKVVEAKIEGGYLKLRGLMYGETSISLRSHDRQKTLTVRVERPAISLNENMLTLYPGEIRKNISIRGGGDDYTMEVVNDESAIDEPRRDASTGMLELVAKHEGEAKIIFKTKDNKHSAELKVVVKADNDVSAQPGFYLTNAKTLLRGFAPRLLAHREGQRVWIYSSNKVSDRFKTRVDLPTIKAPQEGTKHTLKVTMVSVPGGFQNGDYEFVVEKVVADKGLVTLRARGFKLVVPYDK